MVVVSYSGREINAKIVYYGPGLGGKTTNLEQIYESVPAAHKGKMISMKTKADRTLFFDFLPIDLGDISGFRTRFMLYTVPGQVYYNATRKLVLKGVDAVVFVADSERGKMRENQESLDNLRENLQDYGIKHDELPVVFQYNKRDLNDIYTCEELDAALGRGGRPLIEAVAAEGPGVLETLREVSALLLRKLRSELGQGRTSQSAAPASGPIGALELESPASGRPGVEAATPPTVPPPSVTPVADVSPAAAAPTPPIAPPPQAAPPTASTMPPVETVPTSVTGSQPGAPRLEVVRFGGEATPTAVDGETSTRRLVVPITVDPADLEPGRGIELVIEIRAADAAERRHG